MKPLSSIRVLDLSRVLAGPWCSQMLADLGADVIKVEKPGEGDDTRSWGPPFFAPEENEQEKLSAYFISANRGKKSIAIDMAKPEGQALIKQLASKCDVVLENFKVDGLKKYGLDYESLRKINQKLIYCSITGFGQHGPYRHQAGYDFMVQGMCGLMSVTGEKDGDPMKVAVALVDIMTGMYATVGIQAALMEREKTGKGKHIDVALLDVGIAMMGNIALNYLVSRESPKRYGNAHANIVPYEAFATSDGHIILTVGNDHQFGHFCDIAGRSEWKNDPRFKTNTDRVLNREELLPLIRQVMKAHSKEWWLQKLHDAGVPCGPINTLEDVFNDSQVQARGIEIKGKDKHHHDVPMVRNPLLFDNEPVISNHAPPLLGQHTETVLRQLLEISPEELAEFKSKSIIS